MNYRMIFNPDYNFIGIILIAILITTISLIYKNSKYILKILSKVFIFSGITVSQAKMPCNR